MTLEEFNWEAPQINSEDQLLIDAYLEVGVPVDSLAYTASFETIVHILGKNSKSNDDRRTIFRRLLSLRKKGMLPRIYSRPTETNPPAEKAG